jgi:UDP-N-acetylmuramate dehydrogenase
VEVKDILAELEAIHTDTLEKRIFTNKECRFGYRDSVFKQELKGKYIILRVMFLLSKKPVIRLDYGNIRAELQQMNITGPDIRSVREAVINIRKRKLPDPAITGNAGSFFKNPVVTPDQFQKLALANPGIVSFPQDEKVKIAAAWLIEQCGWKGYREGDAGVHKDQPLVLINFGNATGNEILVLGEKIQASVLEKFGIKLEREVNVIG